MKKKILAFLTISIASTSFADVTLYGRLAAGVEADQFQDTTIPSAGSIQNYGSYFGIRGVEPVYGDTSAIWQVEQLLDLTSGQSYYQTTANGSVVNQSGGAAGPGRITNEVNTLASSDSFLGLQGDFGKIRFGNLSNYMRSNMGAIDMYNYGMGVNGPGIWSRMSVLLPDSIRYDTPTYAGFSLTGQYSFNSGIQPGITGISSDTNFGGGLNGYYSGGTYDVGLSYTFKNFSATLGTQFWENVGTYNTGVGNLNSPGGYPANSAYSNAYANRLELGYNNPDGLILGLGFQITNGLGWTGWANSGGSFNNYLVSSPAYNYPGLAANAYQTQEEAVTLGWHIGTWTPKASFINGGNLMYGGSWMQVVENKAQQIPNTGYKQVVAELDWNITPKTIAYINYGQNWYGSTLQNLAYCGLNCGGTNNIGNVNGNNQFLFNQSSEGIGFSHTF